jgi:hypothetical protein
MVEIRPSMPGDSWLVLSNLRQPEVDELEALGVTSEMCLRYGLVYGNAQTIFINGEAAGIFGVMHYEDGNVPWAVFSKVVDRHPIAFLRAAKRWAESLAVSVVNYVDVRNEAAVKWFAWLGFTLGEPVPYGVNGELFRQVSR